VEKTTKPIAVVTADWHLAPGAWSSRPEIEGDAFYALEQIIQLANKLKVPIIAAGDLLDSKKPDARTVTYMNDVLDGHSLFCGYTDVVSPEVYFIQGQHEMAGAFPWLSSCGRGHHRTRRHLPQTYAVFGDIAFWGFDWLPASMLADTFSVYEETPPLKTSATKNVLVLHEVCVAAAVSSEYYCTAADEHGYSSWLVSDVGVTARDAAIANRLKVMPTQLNDYMIPDWVDLVIVGDTHRHIVFTLKKRNGTPVICLSPGALAMQSTAELSFGHAFILYDDLSFVSVRLNTRPVVHLNIDSIADFNAAIRSANEMKSTMAVPYPAMVPIVLASISKPSAEKWAELQQAYYFPDGNRLGHLFPLLVKQEKVQEEQVIDTEAITMLQTPDALLDYAVAEVTQDDPEVNRLICELLNAPSADVALAESWQKHLEKYNNNNVTKTTTIN
jgi:DNA repair exonuclease SbcCD nuclease subunit